MRGATDRRREQQWVRKKAQQRGEREKGRRKAERKSEESEQRRDGEAEKARLQEGPRRPETERGGMG